MDSSSRISIFDANEYFLEKRLARVPYDVLEEYFSKYITAEKKIGQSKLIAEILINLKIHKNNSDFMTFFSEFIRDYVLSAKESQYLLRVTNSSDVLEWIRSWKDNKFNGQRHDFSLNTSLTLGERFLKDSESNISFPHQVCFLISKSHRKKRIPNGLEILEISETTEFEIIFRKDSRLIEVRGDYQVIRDFVNTAVQEMENPMKSARSLVIGESSDESRRQYIVEPARYIKIEKLRLALDGSYTSASSKTSGSHAHRVTIDTTELQNSSQETDPVLRSVIEKVLRDPDRSKISFKYNNKSYTFGITKSGGLTFMKYMPEEAVTYILSKIQSL
jgi:hypothetical protein